MYIFASNKTSTISWPKTNVSLQQASLLVVLVGVAASMPSDLYGPGPGPAHRPSGGRPSGGYGQVQYIIIISTLRLKNKNMIMVSTAYRTHVIHYLRFSRFRIATDEKKSVSKLFTK